MKSAGIWWQWNSVYQLQVCDNRPSLRLPCGCHPSWTPAWRPQVLWDHPHTPGYLVIISSSHCHQNHSYHGWHVWTPGNIDHISTSCACSCLGACLKGDHDHPALWRLWIGENFIWFLIFAIHDDQTRPPSSRLWRLWVSRSDFLGIRFCKCKRQRLKRQQWL